MAAKRALDVLLAVCALLALFPFLVILGILVRVRIGSPVLFRQNRAGRDEIPFRIVKFRTMTDTRSASGGLLPDAARLVPMGSRMRAWSLDELPELWNVLLGDMSLVGPRPLPVAYLPRYTPVERRRHEVRPGITGWAQVNGRNCTSWEERFAMDLWYVEHRSLWLDARIVARTAAAVLGRSGISADGEATMAELRPPSEGRQ